MSFFVPSEVPVTSSSDLSHHRPRVSRSPYCGIWYFSVTQTPSFHPTCLPTIRHNGAIHEIDLLILATPKVPSIAIMKSGLMSVSAIASDRHSTPISRQDGLHFAAWRCGCLDLPHWLATERPPASSYLTCQWLVDILRNSGENLTLSFCYHVQG